MPIWDPNYYTKLTQCNLEIIFKSDDGETSIPLIHERLRILHQVGEVLLSRYEGISNNKIVYTQKKRFVPKHMVYYSISITVSLLVVT